MNLNSKEDYLHLIEKLCKPLLKYYDDTKSTINLPNRIYSNYSNFVSNLESFSRPLWALSFINNKNLKDKIFRMIINGTNKNSKLYWGQVEDYSQKIVDMPAILFYIYCNKDYFFNAVNKDDINNINKWFLQINKVKNYKSNWLFFPIIINILLKALNLEYDNNIIDYNFNLINNHYLKHGWYFDNFKERDYYNSYSFHFYSLLILYIDKDNKYKDIIIKRAKNFAEDFINFASVDGSFVPYGRSLSYRFGVICFWSGYALNKLDTSNLAVIKGIINRNINYFIDKDIYTSDGLLNVGYTYNNELIKEYYIATSSVYWAFKAFIFMLLDENDIFFKIKEASLPTLKNKVYLKEGQFIITRNKTNVNLFPINLKTNNPVGNDISKYEHVVYSTKFAFNISIDNRSLGNKSLDSTYAVYYDNIFVEKNNTIDKVIDNNIIKSYWYINNDINIISYIIPINEWHLRIFEIESKKNFLFYDFGYSIKSENCKKELNNKEIKLINKDTKQVSIIKNLYSNGIINSYVSYPNTNILYSNVSVPYIVYNIKKGKYLIIDSFYGSDKIYKKSPICNVIDNNIIIKYKDKIIYKSNLNKKVRNNFYLLLNRLKKIIRRLKWM